MPSLLPVISRRHSLRTSKPDVFMKRSLRVVQSPQARHARAMAAEESAASKTKAGPPPPPITETAAGSEGAAATEDERRQAGRPADDADVQQQEEQLSASEKLADALAGGDLELAEDLAKEALTETKALVTAVEAAETKTKETQRTLETLKDQYRRLQADFDNFRSRAEEQRKQATASARAGIVEDLLPLIDNFDAAAKQVKPVTEGEEKINNSYQNLYKQMVDVFRGMGVEAVLTEGHPFDPELHDAIMSEETDEAEDGTVLQEFRKGFQLSGKLLRPAMVKVAVSSSSSNGEAAAAQEGSDA